MTDIGRAIKAARKDQGLTIKQLAEAAGVDEATVGRVERGVTKNPSSADAMQKVLGIGIYHQPERATAAERDPRLSEATFSDLLGALAARHYGGDVPLNGVRPPRESQRNAGPSGVTMPGYDATRYTNQQEADRATQEDETG